MQDEEERIMKENNTKALYIHPMLFKNSLKLSLTPDLKVPFEARKSNQMFLRVKKQVNKKTG